MDLQKGQVLPAISGRNLAGDTVAITPPNFDGYSVIVFWSIYCKPCVAEIDSLLRLQEKFGGRIRIVGVNTDGDLGPARIRTFIQRYEEFQKRKISYTVIFDEKNVITKQLGIGILPTVLVVDRAGKIVNLLVGMQEQEDTAILRALEALLPLPAEGAVEETAAEFDIDVTVPVCGFYDEAGWKSSFREKVTRDKEIDRVAVYARELAMKEAMRQALERLGVHLYEEPRVLDCVAPYGVMVREDPWKNRDPLTNLLNSINFRRYAKVQSTSEVAYGTNYHVCQRIVVDLGALENDLDRIRFSIKPITISFVPINMGTLQRMIFEAGVASMSRYLGRTDFPAYTVYASQDTFMAELEKMSFEGIKVFFADAGTGVIEVEIWR
jgi:thiol-disulfide isomerase/thioredoxin